MPVSLRRHENASYLNSRGPHSPSTTTRSMPRRESAPSCMVLFYRSWPPRVISCHFRFLPPRPKVPSNVILIVHSRSPAIGPFPGATVTVLDTRNRPIEPGSLIGVVVARAVATNGSRQSALRSTECM